MAVCPVDGDAHDRLPQKIQVLESVGYFQGIVMWLQVRGPFGSSDVPKHHVTIKQKKLNIKNATLKLATNIILDF